MPLSLMDVSTTCSGQILKPCVLSLATNQEKHIAANVGNEEHNSSCLPKLEVVLILSWIPHQTYAEYFCNTVRACLLILSAFPQLPDNRYGRVLYVLFKGIYRKIEIVRHFCSILKYQCLHV